jgi:hypothetical protein
MFCQRTAWHQSLNPSSQNLQHGLHLRLVSPLKVILVTVWFVFYLQPTVQTSDNVSSADLHHCVHGAGCSYRTKKHGQDTVGASLRSLAAEPGLLFRPRVLASNSVAAATQSKNMHNCYVHVCKIGSQRLIAGTMLPCVCA